MGGGGSLAHVVAPALLVGKVLALERRNFLVGGEARRDGLGDGSQFSRFELRATLPGLLHQKHAFCRGWRGWLHLRSIGGLPCLGGSEAASVFCAETLV